VGCVRCVEENLLVRLAFAGTQVALDATVIEVVPPLPENDSRFDHLAMACAHTLPSHSAKLSTIPKLPRVDSKFSKRVGKAESVHQSEGRSHQTPPLRRDTSDQIFDINVRDRGGDQRFHDSPWLPDTVKGGQPQRD
jgi:hypothetical protein